jgi:Helix-turn-helix domain
MSAAAQSAIEQVSAGLTGRKPSISDVFRSDLPASARLVYAAMCFYGVNTGRCWVVIPVLARHCGLSQSGVRNALQQLEAAGFVSCVRVSKGGRRKMPDGQSRGIGSEYMLVSQGCIRKEPSTEYRVRTLQPVQGNDEDSSAECVPTLQPVQGNKEEPSTECAGTLHSVCGNPPVSAPIRRREEERKKTSSSCPLEEHSGNRCVASADEGGGEPPGQVDKTEHTIFDAWQERLSYLVSGLQHWPEKAPPSARITGDLRRQIKTALVEQGYSVAHMNHVFDSGELRGWRNWRIGLLHIAREFRERYGHEKFPSCLHCADSGITPGAEETERCARCCAGQQTTQRPLHDTGEGKWRAPKPAASPLPGECPLCLGTGFYRDEPCVSCRRESWLQMPLTLTPVSAPGVWR